MPDESAAGIGTLAWCDLTIENADEVRDFYAQITLTIYVGNAHPTPPRVVG